MGIFLKDPKTCMNPWQGLAVLVSVCCLVLLVLLIGHKRYKKTKAIDQQKLQSPITHAQPAY